MAHRSSFARAPRPTVAASVLLLAWMPSLLFFGHWSELAAPSAHHAIQVATHHESGVPSDRPDHAAHCHGSSECSDQGAAANAVDLGASSLLAAATRPLEVVTTLLSDPAAEGRSSARPDAPPPRTAA